MACLFPVFVTPASDELRHIVSVDSVLHFVYLVPQLDIVVVVAGGVPTGAKNPTAHIAL